MTPLHVGTNYTYDFGFYSKGNASATYQRVWAGSLKPQFAWAEGLRPLRTPVKGGTPPFKIPPYSLFRPKCGRKTINFLTHFHWFVLDTNYKHLECFVMLGTLSKSRRGQMSHICDISALRVKAWSLVVQLVFTIISHIVGFGKLRRVEWSLLCVNTTMYKEVITANVCDS